MKAAVNTASREMDLFITASYAMKALPAHLYFAAAFIPLSVIFDPSHVITDHGQECASTLVHGARVLRPQAKKEQ